MNWIDYAILAVIGISVLISLMRGFVREVLSIIVWIGAVWLAVRYANVLSPFLSGFIDSPSIRIGAAFVGIFVITLLIGAALNHLAVALVGKTGLTGTDRVAGIFFGAARGLLLVAFVVMLLALTEVPRESWWQESVMISHIQPWVCRIGVEEWLADLKVYTPLVQESVSADGTPAPAYWGEFCGSMSD
ncbi:colicin V production protein [Alkalilimnicola ehrlichii]|uniref:Colicin V production protein n=1 Tax=Alkalilimnicola ehrlichii TaxID=351052 RepID=A0A3E0X3E3_9GAMM|nr:CvpA family protein [Alkalilimnicola ehrlichii]RFA30887.1 colicin V production protein [Alkalilimnicola ehrlichii]RFA38837.1 colicin V production protein [Alkalilimnicola ehrlichii]